jgi:hypothetical protein
MLPKIYPQYSEAQSEVQSQLPEPQSAPHSQLGLQLVGPRTAAALGRLKIAQAEPGMQQLVWKNIAQPPHFLELGR